MSNFGVTPAGAVPFRSEVVYGPVCSRRLGASLGVNLLPPGRRTCTYACEYCFFERFPPLTPEAARLMPGFPSVDAVERLLRARLEELSAKQPPDAITFSGNGEPTLHPDFQAATAVAFKARNDLAPTALLVLMTNGASLDSPSTTTALAHFDVVMAKLDIVDATTFAIHNAPNNATTLDAVVDVLAGLTSLTIQTAVTRRILQKPLEESLRPYLRRLRRIQPQRVDLYNVAYTTPACDVPLAVTTEVLEQVANHIRSQLGLPVQVFP